MCPCCRHDVVSARARVGVVMWARGIHTKYQIPAASFSRCVFVIKLLLFVLCGSKLLPRCLLLARASPTDHHRPPPLLTQTHTGIVTCFFEATFPLELLSLPLLSTSTWSHAHFLTKKGVHIATERLWRSSSSCCFVLLWLPHSHTRACAHMLRIISSLLFKPRNLLSRVCLKKYSRVVLDHWWEETSIIGSSSYFFWIR